MSEGAPRLEPLAVSGDGAAALFGIGRSTWFKLRAAGRTPRPRRLGEIVRGQIILEPRHPEAHATPRR